MKDGQEVTVEFYGMARQNAGRALMTASGRTLAEVLQAVARECPALRELVQNGEIDRHYLISIDGREFLTDPTKTIASGTRILILGADVGG
jgi:hypothetical protein